jgi:hypothetical protein
MDPSKIEGIYLEKFEETFSKNCKYRNDNYRQAWLSRV